MMRLRLGLVLYCNCSVEPWRACWLCAFLHVIRRQRTGVSHLTYRHKPSFSKNNAMKTF